MEQEIELYTCLTELKQVMKEFTAIRKQHGPDSFNDLLDRDTRCRNLMKDINKMIAGGR